MRVGMLNLLKSPPRVLVIEDTYISSEYVKRALLREGFEVEVASTVVNGFWAALEFDPDLILLDVMLPDGDGFSLCEQMKREARLVGTPIIFLTSLEDVGSRVRGLSIGAVDFIAKPFATEELVVRVRLHIRIARQARMLADARSERLASLKDAQRLFLTDPGAVPEARCAVYYESAEEAGGDQYDIVELGPDIFGFLVADTAGHGIETIFQASALKALFRDNASVLELPGDTLFMINRSIRAHLSENRHLTAFYMILNRRTAIASFSSAGHFPALVTAQDGRVRRLTTEGDVLGAFTDPFFRTATHEIETGSRYWLYTDGILEDFGTGLSWQSGLKRLEAAVSETNGLPIGEALESVRETMVPRGPASDDRCLMAIDA